MPSKHARLSPSAAARWINCPGSVRLSEQVPPEGSTSYADEGTVAHSLAEAKLRYNARQIGRDIFDAECNRIEKSEYYCGEMDEATDFYANLVWEKLMGAGPDAVLMVEQRLDLSDWAPDCFGTSDAVAIGGDAIEVIDLKYGKTKVLAPGNPQLRLYGLGAADLFEGLYDFGIVRVTIVQPRLDHISTEEISLEELRQWGEETVRPAAKEAMDPTIRPTVAAGDWCRWCPARAVCRTRAEENLRLAAYDFEKPDLLEPFEIGDILTRGEALERWVADVQEYALQQALQGEHFDGWKLVEGRSVRKYTDDLKVAETLQKAGFPEAALYERKLLGITAMEKLVGKKKLAETLGDLIVKPAGKPALVPESDKRPPISTTDSAKEDFG